MATCSYKNEHDVTHRPEIDRSPDQSQTAPDEVAERGREYDASKKVVGTTRQVADGGSSSRYPDSLLTIMGKEPVTHDPEVTFIAPAKKQIPIIIVPGVMASKLYDTEGKIVWLPLPKLWKVLKMEMSNALVVIPPENQHEALKKEYGVLDTYENLVERLIEEFPGLVMSSRGDPVTLTIQHKRKQGSSLFYERLRTQAARFVSSTVL